MNFIRPLLLSCNHFKILNSRRAGEYTAVVEKDVFSFDSKEVLIPKGSKFVCAFETLQAYGETARTTIDLSTKFLEKTIDLAPVVTISSGTRIIIKLQVDVNLEPLEN